MSNRTRCRCQSCTINSMMGPAILITIGCIFLLSEMRGGFFGWSNTWPVILLVIGVIKLASAFSSKEGHIDDAQPLPPVQPQPPAVPPVNPPAAPYQGGPYQGQG